MNDITIVDYGVGNIGSIFNLLKKAEATPIVTSDPRQIEQACRLLLPGVGAFDSGMQKLHERGLVDVLGGKVIERRTPILGICLGMQLFARCSEEGSRPGLGWLDAEVVRFRFPEAAGLRVPHMGWNAVSPVRDSVLAPRDATPARFYFAHSFHMRCHDPGDVAAVARYGDDVVAIVERGNVLGVQFHPEKSHRFGLELIRRFLAIS